MSLIFQPQANLFLLKSAGSAMMHTATLQICVILFSTFYIQWDQKSAIFSDFSSTLFPKQNYWLLDLY